MWVYNVGIQIFCSKADYEFRFQFFASIVEVRDTEDFQVLAAKAIAAVAGSFPKKRIINFRPQTIQTFDGCSFGTSSSLGKSLSLGCQYWPSSFVFDRPNARKYSYGNSYPRGIQGAVYL